MIGTNKERKTKEYVSLLSWTIISVLFLFGSTDMFPWNFIEKMGTVGRLFVQVQYPTRYLGLVMLGTTILVGLLIDGYIIDNYKRIIIDIIVSAACFSSMVFFSQYSDLKMNYVQRDTADLGVFSEWTYVLQGCNSAVADKKLIGEGIVSADIVNKGGLLYEIDVTADEDGANMNVPLFNYKGYRAWDDNGNNFRIKDGFNRQVLVELPADYSVVITVALVEPWYWKMGSIISVLTIIGVISILIVVNKTKMFAD